MCGCTSPATNLVTGDTNDMTDVFVRDLAAGVTTLVSVATNGTQGDSGSTFPSLSYSGRYVAFTSSASTLVPGDNNLEAADVFVRDRIAEITRRVSVGPGGAEGNSSSGNSGPAISSNGQHVAFDSRATNLVTNDTTESQTSLCGCGLRLNGPPRWHQQVAWVCGVFLWLRFQTNPLWLGFQTDPLWLRF